MKFISNTETFFRRQASNPSPSGPFAIVLTLAILFLARYFLFTYASRLQTDIGQTTEVLIGPVSIGLYIYMLVFPFLVWGLYATAFYVLSAAFGADGSFGTTLILTGWGFASRILTDVLTLLLLIWIILQLPEQTTATAYERLVWIRNHRLLTVSTAISIIVTFWAIPHATWVYAVKHARNITTKQAIVVVNIPVTVSILFNLHLFLTDIGLL